MLTFDVPGAPVYTENHSLLSSCLKAFVATSASYRIERPKLVLNGISSDCPKANSSAVACSQKEKVLPQRSTILSTNWSQKVTAA